jgi:hypothetical protein
LQYWRREFKSHRDLRADVAQLEERDVANVKVAGSVPVVCSKYIRVNLFFWNAKNENLQ